MKDVITASLAAALPFLILSPAARGEASLTIIYNPNDPSGSCFSTSVSADASTVLGVVDTYGSGYLWTDAGGFQLIGGAHTYDLTSDGSMVVGNTEEQFSGNEVDAGIWTQASGWTSLGRLAGSAGCDLLFGSGYDISRDGSVAVGLAWDGCSGRPFRWTAAMGMHQAPRDAPSHSARVNTISGDGRVLGGWETADFGYRRPVLWLSDTTEVFLGTDPGVSTGEVFDLNHDGSIAVGTTDGRAFVWTESGGTVWLPDLPGAFGTQMAVGVSDDGRVIVGRYGDGPGTLVAGVWVDGQPYALLDYLIANGVTGFDGWLLQTTQGVSADGTVIVGHCFPPDLQSFHAYRAIIPALSPVDCPADVAPAGGDRSVNTDDLLAVLAAWGTCGEPCPPYCAADTNGDCAVDTDDLLNVLGNWGACEPVAACCSYDGTECDDLTQFECNVRGGIWNPGASCATYACPGAPLGACCIPGQQCVMTDERDCAWAGGIAWYPGEDCATFTCPPQPTGACCLWPTDVCSMLSEYDCAQADGDFYGAGVDCSTVTCPPAPLGDTIEYPFPISALPYSDTGNTTGFRDDYDESCSGGGQPVAAPDVAYAYTPPVSQFVTLSMCGGSPPTFQARMYVYEDLEGNLVACSEQGDCPIYPYPPLIENMWMEAGHTYYIVIDGDQTGEEDAYTIEVSEPLYGACCAYPTIECSDLTEFDCYRFGEGHWVWLGPGTECATAVCPDPPQGDTIGDPIVIGALPYTDTQTFPPPPIGVPWVWGNWYQDGFVGGPMGNTYWSRGVEVVYTYTPTSNKVVDIQTCNTSQVDPTTLLFVYDGLPIFGDQGAGTFGNYIAFGDVDSCDVGSTHVAIWSLLLTAGHTYFIVVDSDCNQWSPCGLGTYQLDIVEVGE